MLENPDSKSTLVHSLSVCISLLDPKRAASVAAAGVSRGQQKIEHVHTANPETVVGMLQRLGLWLSNLPAHCWQVYIMQPSLQIGVSWHFFFIFEELRGEIMQVVAFISVVVHGR